MTELRRRGEVRWYETRMLGGVANGDASSIMIDALHKMEIDNLGPSLT